MDRLFSGAGLLRMRDVRDRSRQSAIDCPNDSNVLSLFPCLVATFILLTTPYLEFALL
jgi:hypothetical protein